MASVPPQGGRKHPHQDFIQINTSNILFICGGAFESLDKIIDRRLGLDRRSLGFLAGNRPVYKSKQQETDVLLKQVTHDDLLRYGLIPEFVGRLPMVVALESLDQESMVRILTEPKNALVKQFQRFFAMDGVELVMTPEAREACADEAIRHKTGARGLRTVMEDTLLETMYEIPSRPDVKKCIINADTITKRQRPILLNRSGQVIELGENQPHGETA